MQLKASEIDGWLKRPDQAVRAVLVHGPDRGLVAERARAFAERSGVPLDDPFSVIRLQAAEVENDPGRLLGELRTLAMFSDRRLVWVRDAGAQKEIAEAVNAVEAGETDAVLLIEAGDLKKSSALRAAAETGRQTISLPCYADDSRSLDALIDAECAAAGKTLTIDARAALRNRLGGDRLASRGEIAKLLLYAGDAGRIEAEDVEAIIGDASAQSVDAVVDAVLAGDLRAFDRAFSKAVQAGQHPYLMLSAAMRQFSSLAAMRATMTGSGKTAAAVVASARPPIFFARKSLVEGALQRSSDKALAAALERLQKTVLASRRLADLAEETTRQNLLALALAMRPRRIDYT